MRFAIVETCNPFITELLLRSIYAMNTNGFVLLDVFHLVDGSFPPAPLEAAKEYGNLVTIQLDAAYHVDHDPQFGKEGVRITLSFDKLYDCFIPYGAVRQARVQLPAYAPVETEKPAGPGLKLV